MQPCMVTRHKSIWVGFEQMLDSVTAQVGDYSHPSKNILVGYLDKILLIIILLVRLGTGICFARSVY